MTLTEPHFNHLEVPSNGRSVEAGLLASKTLEIVNSPERNIPYHDYNRGPGMRRIMTGDRRVLQFTTYFDGDELFGDLTGNTIEARAKQYYNKEIWESDEIKVDPARGDNVEFVTLVTPAAGDTPLCSLRKEHALTFEEAMALPSLAKFKEEEKEKNEEVLDPKAEQILKASVEEGNTFVEIMALFSNTSNYHDLNALFGCALADSIKKKETWVMGMVGPVHEGFTKSCGDKAIQTVGKPVAVKDGLAREKVMITPVIIEPAKVPEQMLQSIEEAEAKGDEFSTKLMKARLTDFAQQFTTFNWKEYFGEETATRLDELVKKQLAAKRERESMK